MENTLSNLFSLDALSNQLAINQILDRNEQTAQYGLTLTPGDAAALMETRTQSLNETGRIEIGSATVGKLIDAFADSAWINQRDYAATLHELVDLFYTVKNETMDLISDDDLIAFMKKNFEDRCGGSLELLAGRELEKLADNLRFGVKEYYDMEQEISFEEDLLAEEEEAAEDQNDWDETPEPFLGWDEPEDSTEDYNV